MLLLSLVDYRNAIAHDGEGQNVLGLGRVVGQLSEPFHIVVFGKYAKCGRIMAVGPHGVDRSDQIVDVAVGTAKSSHQDVVDGII